MTEASVVIRALALGHSNELNAAVASMCNQTPPAREIILAVDER